MANFFLDNKDLQFQLDHPLMKKIVALKERNFADKDKYDYAPVDYEDAVDSYRKVLEIVGEICGDTIAVNADGVDKEGPRVVDDHVVYASGTAENHRMLTEAGVYGISLPRRWGGLHCPVVPYVMSCELVSRADAGFGNIWGLQDCAETLHEFASDEINDEYMPQVCAGKTCAMDLTEPDAGSDLQAMGVYEAARQNRLRIPEDLSVVGFDDVQTSAFLGPALTTVRQPLHDMAAVSTRMLIDTAEGRPTQHHVILPTTLVVRGSTARLASEAR